MLLLFWVLLFLTAAFLILLMPALWGKHIYNTYHDGRTVNCPETHARVTVRFNALRAAYTALSGKPYLILEDCSRWPERAGCDQACLPDAKCATPEPEVRLGRPTANKIAHLPALVAAGAAWVLGMAWHSEYMFRSQWARTIGLTDQEAHDLARTWMPHLATVFACLLFAYGVAWLLAWIGRRSIWTGLQVAVATWFVIAAILLITYPLTARSDFRWIEGGYTLLSAVLIGLIVGGAPRRILARDSE